MRLVAALACATLFIAAPLTTAQSTTRTCVNDVCTERVTTGDCIITTVSGPDGQRTSRRCGDNGDLSFGTARGGRGSGSGGSSGGFASSGGRACTGDDCIEAGSAAPGPGATVTTRPGGQGGSRSSASATATSTSGPEGPSVDTMSSNTVCRDGTCTTTSNKDSAGGGGGGGGAPTKPTAAPTEQTQQPAPPPPPPPPPPTPADVPSSGVATDSSTVPVPSQGGTSTAPNAQAQNEAQTAGQQGEPADANAAPAEPVDGAVRAAAGGAAALASVAMVLLVA